MLKGGAGAATAVVNTMCWPRKEVVTVPGGDGSPAKKRSRAATENGKQTDKDGNTIGIFKFSIYLFIP